MAPPQENSSEINTSPKYFVLDMNLLFIAGLFLIYEFVDLAVLPILTDFQTTEKDPWIAVVVINLRDGLSSIILVFSLIIITKADTDCFPMTTVCTAASSR
ncbi:hypothetical protein E2542_SST13337 [Spatholobus suberectus]|nr:hypothetical protein E2542_SST13337 [Spatholobus suberectus]